MIQGRISLLCAALVLASGLSNLARAELLRYEPYDYLPGDTLQGKVNPDGEEWLRAGVADPPTNIRVVSGNLSVPPEIKAAVGNSLEIDGTGGASGSTVRLGLGQAITAGSVYYSFPLRVDELTGSNTTVGGFFIGLNNSTGSQATNPGVVVTRIQARIDPNDSTKYQLGLFNAGASTGAATWITPTLDVGETHFIVASYEFNPAAGDDVSRIWIDPSDLDTATPPAPTMTFTGGDISGGQVASIILRQSPAPHLTLDELRVGTTWDDVTVPEPATWGLLLVACLAPLRARRKVR
jgi:hypothetical protein